MKKSISLIIALMLLVTIALSACDKPNDEIDKSAWLEMPDNTNPNFKYFGYYHFSASIDEVAEMGNANFAKVDAEDLEEIQHLYTKGFKILIMIRHIFFEDNETPADYSERWTTAKSELQPYMDKIIGFYVDEPMWTGKSQEAFHLACQTVRADYPDKRMVAMLMYGSISASQAMYGIDSAEYCKYCTDVGYDFYRTWDRDRVLSDIQLLKDNVAIYGQDIWLSPKGFYVTDPNKNANFIFENTDLEPGEDIIMWIKGCYEIAVQDERIVGFLTFVYGDDNTGEDYDIWLKRFFDPSDEYYNPEMKALYIQIGKAVIANDTD
jgi:hypothetical protein